MLACVVAGQSRRCARHESACCKRSAKVERLGLRALFRHHIAVVDAMITGDFER